MFWNYGCRLPWWGKVTLRTTNGCLKHTFTRETLPIGRLQSLDWTGGPTLKIIFIVSNKTHQPVGLHGCIMITPKLPAFYAQSDFDAKLINGNSQCIAWASKLPGGCCFALYLLGTESSSVDEAWLVKRKEQTMYWVMNELLTWALHITSFQVLARNNQDFRVSGTRLEHYIVAVVC